MSAPSLPTDRGLGNRRRLPNRRRSESLTLEHAGLRYTVSFSRFDAGELAEVFIANHKRGGGADTAGHLLGAYWVMTDIGRPRKKRAGVSGHPGVTRLIAYMEETALDLGQSWSLDKHSGQGTLIPALEILRRPLGNSFFPAEKDHPLSTYQNALTSARKLWRNQPLEHDENL